MSDEDDREFSPEELHLDWKPCRRCEGTGRTTETGFAIRCPDCDGTGNDPDDDE